MVQGAIYLCRQYVQAIAFLVREHVVRIVLWLFFYVLHGVFDFESCVRCGMLRSILLYLYLRRLCLKSLHDILDIGNILRGTFPCLLLRPKRQGRTIHHCKIGDWEVADGTVVHAVAADGVSVAI